MKTFNKFNKIGFLLGIFLLVITISFQSCTDDLEKLPLNSDTDDIHFTSVDAYKQSLAGAYSKMAYENFLRHYWSMQEYTTDMAVSTWNDGGDGIYHELAWSADSPAIANVYTSALTMITLCNDFVNQSSDEVIAKRGFSGADAAEIKQMQAEARYLRAYCYWILMDCYGNPPFPTEKTLAKSFPKQIQRADLFKYLESELKELETQLADPKSNESGRPDKAAAWALLSRMYLNANIYTNESKNTEAIAYCNKIINAGYSLESKYEWLMLGDNHLNTNEFIFTIKFDNTNKTWNGTNFLSLGAAGVPASINGMSGSWNSFRFTQQVPALFPSTTPTIDKRAMFYTSGQSLEVNKVSTSTDGYSAYKYRNIKRDGTPLTQNNSFGNLSDIDFPVFRLAEIYLTYAEAVLRGGIGGDRATALSCINRIRGRAYANNSASTSGNISDAAMNLDFILDERARELYWETHRRTDLVRYNKLTTSSYLWAWKGNVKAGTAVDPKYNLFPIPTADLLVNPNLKQIDGF